MIVVDDLWVGDLLRLKKSGRIGKFEAIIDGKIRVKIDDKTVLTTITNLEYYIEPKTEHHLFLPDDGVTDICPPERVIDLHIEKLNPSLTNGKPERILDYQIKAAKEYLEQVIALKYSSVIIIHGKGTGVLKLEIRHLLSLYSEVQLCLDTNKGGGTEVVFCGIRD